MEDRIAVGIVLYNPDIDRVVQSINELLLSFSTVILYDNSNRDNSEYFHINNVEYISEINNKGIAYALNKLMHRADKLNYDWVLTFDQDTKIPVNIYSEYSKYLSLNNAAILCPQIIDKRRKYMKINEDTQEYEEVGKCITSGSCTKIKTWKDVKGYDDTLFIDLVDNDFSKRVVIRGKKIYKINAVILDQEFGDIEFTETWSSKFFIRLGKLLNNKNIAKLSYKKNINPMRIYYTNRNVIYLNKKHKNYGGIGYESYYCTNFITFYLLFNIASIFRSKQKLATIKAVLKGTFNGIQMSKHSEPYDLIEL